MGQGSELQLQGVEGLQTGAQLGAGRAVLVEQLVQRREASLQGSARGVRHVLQQCGLGLLGGGGCQLGCLAELAAGALRRFGQLAGPGSRFDQTGEPGVLAHLQQQLQQRRVRGGEPGELRGTLRRTTGGENVQLGNRLAPVRGVVTEVKLFHFHQ